MDDTHFNQNGMLNTAILPLEASFNPISACRF